jgi:hypothetical protein
MTNTSPYRTLAEILTSRKVGLAHVHVVGDVIVAQSVLNEWFAGSGKQRLTPDEWADIAERVLAVEDQYKLLWEELNSEHQGSIGSTGLRDLENALRNAASTLRGINEDLRYKHG